MQGWHTAEEPGRRDRHTGSGPEHRQTETRDRRSPAERHSPGLTQILVGIPGSRSDTSESWWHKHQWHHHHMSRGTGARMMTGSWPAQVSAQAVTAVRTRPVYWHQPVCGAPGADHWPRSPWCTGDHCPGVRTHTGPSPGLLTTEARRHGAIFPPKTSSGPWPLSDPGHTWHWHVPMYRPCLVCSLAIKTCNLTLNQCLLFVWPPTKAESVS